MQTLYTVATTEPNDLELNKKTGAKLLDEKRPKGKRTPASRALWRAFTALSAARYHLQHTAGEEGERVRELRTEVEELWRRVSPMFDEHGGPLPDPVPDDDDDDE